MQAERRNFHRPPRAPIGRVQGKSAMDKESNPIKEAEEMLKRPYARVQSIANAWELLLNGELVHSEPRRLRVEGLKEFIDGLSLTIHYEDGSLASKSNSPSTWAVMNKHSICVRVQSVHQAAIAAKLDWPILPSSAINNEPASESSLPTERPVVSVLPDKKLVRKFSRSTIAVLVESIRKKSNLPNDLNAIWAELMALAKSKESPVPLVGFAPSEGIQYRGTKFDDSEELDIYTKEALRAYLARHKF